MRTLQYFILVKSWVGQNTESVDNMGELQKLLDDGWQPVRESPMGGGVFPGKDTQGIGWYFCSLVLLEKK